AKTSGPFLEGALVHVAHGSRPGVPPLLSVSTRLRRTHEDQAAGAPLVLGRREIGQRTCGCSGWRRRTAGDRGGSVPSERGVAVQGVPVQEQVLGVGIGK